MAKILLDPDVILCWLGGGDPPARLIPQLLEKSEVLVWTPMQVADIFFFCRGDKQQVFGQLYQVLEPVPVTGEIGRKAGSCLIACMVSQHLNPDSAYPAASTVTYDMPLWTLSKQPYPISEIKFFQP